MNEGALTPWGAVVSKTKKKYDSEPTGSSPGEPLAVNNGCSANRWISNLRSYRIVRPVGSAVNPMKPNDPYSGRTAPLTSKHCILYICSTNIGTEYFKHGIYSPLFSLFKMQFDS